MRDNTNNTGWRSLLDGAAWNKEIARLGGHPLQSSLWGDVRRVVDGIEDLRLVHYSKDGLIDCLARVETRKIPACGKVAWVPRGPTFINKNGSSEITSQLRALLAKEGYLVYIDDIYSSDTADSDIKRPQTIWIDLRQGRDILWSKLNQQWRYGVRAAARAGVIVEHGIPDDVKPFYCLCKDVSARKGFQLPASELLMRKLLDTSGNGHVSSHLFLARHKGKIASGAFILSCGKSIHYFWGASDRNLFETAYRRGCSVGSN